MILQNNEVTLNMLNGMSKGYSGSGYLAYRSQQYKS